MSLTTIRQVGVALDAFLKAHGCPLDVIDGPDIPTTTWGRERIVLEYDDDGTTSFGNPHGLHVNAKHSFTASDPMKATIYAQAKRSGSLVFEHRARAILVREQVLSGLRYVAATNKNKFAPKSGRFITPPDLAATETQAGAVYEIKLTYDLPVRVVTFAGSAQPEGELTAMTSMTMVSRTGDADDDDNTNTPPITSAVACGA